VKKTEAARIRSLLAARYPDTPVEVTPETDGARIFLEHEDGFHVRVTTGDRPGPVLRALLGRDLRVIDGEADGTA
jgi:hypothetical protein